MICLSYQNVHVVTLKGLTNFWNRLVSSIWSLFSTNLKESRGHFNVRQSNERTIQVLEEWCLLSERITERRLNWISKWIFYVISPFAKEWIFWTRFHRLWDECFVDTTISKMKPIVGSKKLDNLQDYLVKKTEKIVTQD